MQSPLRQLQRTVIHGGYCIGCGACAAMAPDSVRVEMTPNGFYQARVTDPDDGGDSAANALAVCPFSGVGADEDQIADALFSTCQDNDHRIGRYINCYAGRVSQESAFLGSSSGGIGKWILGQLLEHGLVDSVIQVCDTPAKSAGSPLFRYEVIMDREHLYRGSKSAYYPIELSGVVQHILNHDGRYAITGVPCFIKAIRLLCHSNATLNERIRFTVGLVCGHLKGSFYAEMLGWQLGVPPPDLEAIDFRAKLPGKKANEKGVTAKIRSSGGKETQAKTVQELFGTNYGQGFFKYKACDYCDDVVSETADVSVGDAWLPRYMDSGTSLIIVRNLEIQRLLDSGVSSGEIYLDSISADDAALSQDAGLRHRREGLSYRLQIKKMLGGGWAPAKRIESGSLRLTVSYKVIIILRLLISRTSIPVFRYAKRWQSWHLFRIAMTPLVFVYAKFYRLQHANVFRAIARRLRIFRINSNRT